MARHSSTRHLLRLPWQLQSLEDRSQPSVVRVSPSLLDLPPTANDFTSDTDGTNPVSIDLLSKAFALGDHTLVPGSILVTVPPQRGTISINPTTGSATYTATGYAQGTDSFQYTVRDSAGVVSNPATITVIVHRPTANDDFAQIDNGGTAIVDVLANDTDPEGNSEIVPSKVRLLSLPLHGTVSINSTNGSVTYKPERTFAGTETLLYTITDRAGAESAPGRITIVVRPITVIPTAAPVANDDAADTDGTNPVEVAVLGNDMAAAGLTLDPASIQIAAAPSRGTVTVDATTGIVTYTAGGFFMGTDTFAYTVKDSKGVVSNVASITIVINRPTANDDFADTDGNNPVVLDVLANDTDPDGNEKIDKTSVKILSIPMHGRTSIDAATGKITYTAIGAFQGTDTFQYTVKDEAGAESAPGTVTVVVNRPTANEDSAYVNGSEPVAIAVLQNDTDPDGNEELDKSSIQIVSPPAHGSVTVDPVTGLVNYTPSGKYIGTDLFTYTVTDFPGAVSNVAPVRVRVNSSPKTQITVAGADVGGGPRVNVYNADGSVRSSFFAYDPSFTGGVRVATGDVNGDGIPDVVTAAGVGGHALVEVFDGTTLKMIASYNAYDPAFQGDVSVAVGDVNGDGKADVITGAGVGGGPHVRVYNVSTGTDLMSFFAYDPSFRGGVNVASGDVNGDGFTDVITGAGAGGGPHVQVFSGSNGSVLQSFFAYAPSFTGGITVAAGDFNGDGLADVITGTGVGGGPQVNVFDGKDDKVLKTFFVYDDQTRDGIRVASGDVNADGRSDLIVSSGAGKPQPNKVFDGKTFDPIQSNDPFDNFNGGVFVGGPG